MAEVAMQVEYKVLKFRNHQQMETTINEWTEKGWQIVSYQAAGDSSMISHFVILSRPATT